VKNPSPWYVAAIASLIAGTVPSVVLIFQEYHLPWVVLIFFLTSIVSFIVIYYLLQIFIYQKIKLIYKNIFRFKSSRPRVSSSPFTLTDDPLGEVEKDVLEWMRDNKKEIDELKELETYRKEFLGNVSHELKTPIQSVQGYIYTLLDGALEDKKVNRAFLEKAGKGTDRLAQLVNDLTSISELQSGAVQLDVDNFDIVALFKEEVEMLADRIKNKSIKVRFTKDSPEQLLVKGDSSKIEQVVTNLLINAIKYGKHEGTIVIGFDVLGNEVLVEVTDNGEGIAKEHLPRLFERFYRTDAGRSRHEGGSGLGLAIAKHIIAAHGQSISVRSVKGEGSTFSFTLEKA
jgi:two-component system phosphate regulon sensor histidine kinase PhoR